MPAPAADCATNLAAASSPPSGAGTLNINPSTGLSTDYLNHFSEALMALEMAAAPECLDDLLAWRPKSYTEHFATSRFRDRAVVIAAYWAADAATREALDRASKAVNIALVTARDDLLRGLVSPCDGTLGRRLDELRQLIGNTAALINGVGSAPNEPAPQAAIDAIFGR